MGFLDGLNLAKAEPNYRRNRFLAFVVDLIIVVLIWFVCDQIFGKPDFKSVKLALDAAMALPADAQAQAMQIAFREFSEAYLFGLILWFAYDALTTVITGGSTIGKLIMGLKITPMNPARNPLVHRLLLLVRSLIKVASLYIFQSIPFVICGLTVLTSSSRSGFDFFVKTQVTQKEKGVSRL